MFIRRLYYEKADGACVLSYAMDGDIIRNSVDQDYEGMSDLEVYADRRQEIGLIEWLEPDAAIEESFKSAFGVTVDTGQNPPVVMFDYTPEDTTDDRDEALRLLGIIQEGDD